MRLKMFTELCRELGLTPAQLRRVADDIDGKLVEPEPTRVTEEHRRIARAALLRAGIELI